MYFVTLGHYVCPSRVSVDTRGVVGFVHTSLSVLLMGTNYQRSSYPFASSPVPRPGTDVTECVTFVTLGLHPVTCIYWLHHRLLCLGWLRYPYCILFAHYCRLTYLIFIQSRGVATVAKVGWQKCWVRAFARTFPKASFTPQIWPKI